MAKAARKSSGGDGPRMTMPEFAPGDEGAALSQAGAQALAIQMVPVDALRIMPGFNIRVTDTDDYREGIQELKRSIDREGFYQAKPLAGIVGKDGDKDVVYVTDGHRRLEAVRLAVADGAEVASVPVALKPPGTTAVDLTVALKKENTGRPLKMAENAVLAKRLLKAGMSESEVAERLDFTERYVQDLQILIAAPKAVRELVKRDKIAGTTAVTLLRKHVKDPARAEEEMQRMVERAEKRGAKRASAKDSTEGTKGGRVAHVPEAGDDELDEPGPKLRPRLHTHKVEWVVDAGQRFELKEVRLFSKLIGDTDWYQAEPNGIHAVATEPMRFRATIERATERAEAAPPARKLSKRAQAALDAEEDEDPDAPLPGIDVTNALHDEVLSDAEDAPAEVSDAEARELEHADL